MEKVPYMLILGDREAKDGNVAVRSREKGDQGSLKLDEFIAKLTAELAE